VGVIVIRGDWFAIMHEINALNLKIICDTCSILELSNMLRCHGTWLSFLIQLVAVSLLLNPPPERGGWQRILLWHEAVI